MGEELPSFPISHPKSTTTPTAHLLLSSPRHPCILEEKPQTSFLLCQFVFPNASTRPFTISACFALLKPSEQRSPTNVALFKISSPFVSLIHPFCVLPPVTDSLWFAAGPQSAVVRHPFLEQLEPCRPSQPRPAAGSQLPLSGKESHRCMEEERETEIAREQQELIVYWCFQAREGSCVGDTGAAANSLFLTAVFFFKRGN